MNKPFDVVVNSIVNRLSDYLDRSGMYYRIFFRAKSIPSLQRKIKRNPQKYTADGKKIQDLIGIRVVFYFQEDVSIFHDKLKQMDGYDPNNESNSSKDLEKLTEWIDAWGDDRKEDKQRLEKIMPFNETVFMPERLNIVMQLDEEEKELVNQELGIIEGIDSSVIDDTYEVQLRTVLSEGWHEVEHDLRYKMKGEPWWSYCKDESRMLNGIYASLETSERALSQMIDGVAYKNYKNKDWDAMLRFHFRRRISENKLSEELCNVLNADDRIAKQILQVSRHDLTQWLWLINKPFTLTTTLVLHIINRKLLHNIQITELETNPIKLILDGVL